MTKPEATIVHVDLLLAPTETASSSSPLSSPSLGQHCLKSQNSLVSLDSHFSKVERDGSDLSGPTTAPLGSDSGTVGESGNNEDEDEEPDDEDEDKGEEQDDDSEDEDDESDGFSDLDDTDRVFDPKAPTIQNMEEYETKMQEDFFTDDPPKRLFFKKSSLPWNYEGSSSYAAPVRLGKAGPTRFELDSTVPEDRPVYIVFCFLLEPEAKDLGPIEIVWIVNKSVVIESIPMFEGAMSFTRVLMRTQVTETKFRIELHNEDETRPAPVHLCYVDIFQEDIPNDSFDCTLPSVPLPRKSINIWHRDDDDDDDDDDDAPLEPAEIYSFDLSASGSHAVTLSSVGLSVFLDVWALDLAKLDQKASYPTSPSTPTISTTIECSPNERRYLKPAVSYDASKIVVSSSNDRYPVELFLLEDPRTSTRRRGRSKNATGLTLKPSTRLMDCNELQSFKGYAGFTYSSATEWSIDSEFFLTCDGMDVSVYDTDGMWSMLYKVQVYSKLDTPKAFRLVSTAAGGVFVTHDLYSLSVWSIESGKIIGWVELDQFIQMHSISSDGSIVAVSTDDTLYLYSTASMELLQRTNIKYQGGLCLSEGSKSVLVPCADGRHDKYIILDSSSLAAQRVLSLPSSSKWQIRDIVPDWSHGYFMKESTMVAQRHGSLLDISFLEDLTTAPGGMDGTLCTLECEEKLQTLEEVVGERVESFPGGTVILSLGGFHGQKPVLTMDIQYEDGGSRQLRLTSNKFFFLSKRTQIMTLFNDGNACCAIWGLPKTAEEKLELAHCWSWENLVEAKSTVQVCRHEGTFEAHLRKKSIVFSPTRALVEENVESFYNAVEWMFVQCIEDQPEVSDAILRYLQSHVNKFPRSKKGTCSVMAAISKLDEMYGYQEYKPFILQLLNADTPWVPQTRCSRDANPVSIFLENAKSDAKAFELVRVLINYCVEKAKSLQDINYLLSLQECMDDLVERYPDIALRTSRAFAFIKCADRDFIIRNHKIAHPPTFRRFWTVDRRKIYHCKNPILQYQYQAEYDKLNTFTEEVFVAPVGLLWRFIPNRQNPCKEFCKVTQQPATTWLRTFYHLVLLHLNPASHVYIRPRFYPIPILDNPAIEAVIQYKWNTFAFALWVARFMIQCVFYLLILFAASIQVYYKEDVQLLGVLIAISALSCLFLWFELLQIKESRQYASLENERRDKGEEETSSNKKRGFFRSGLVLISGQPRGSTKGDQDEEQSNLSDGRNPQSHYFRSLYNILDLAMYLAPLGASIHHMINILRGVELGWAWDLSFCVVLVLLHMLAELRVSRIICKYITIVIRIMIEIRVFFLILAGVVLFFSLAILHVIYGSSNPELQMEKASMPVNFFGAIITVYLMMGGRYDPMADDMMGSDEETGKQFYKNWPLQVMVVIYFFFSSIVMLNVLIALINIAFTEGDDSWRQVWLENRLRYVESAENMSYHIPGFRETFNWFPEKVYYTATQYQVKQYWFRIKRRDEEVDLEYEEDESTIAPSETSNSRSSPGPIERPFSESLASTKMEEVKQQLSQQSQEDKTFIQEQLELQNKELGRRMDQQEGWIKHQGEQVVDLIQALKQSQDDISEMKRDLRALLEALRPVVPVPGEPQQQ